MDSQRIGKLLTECNFLEKETDALLVADMLVAQDWYLPENTPQSDQRVILRRLRGGYNEDLVFHNDPWGKWVEFQRNAPGSLPRNGKMEDLVKKATVLAEKRAALTFAAPRRDD